MNKYQNVIDEVMNYGNNVADVSSNNINDVLDNRNKNGYCNRCGTLLDKKIGCIKCATDLKIQLGGK